MAKILAVGIATLDIINTVDRYPPEDSETRAISQQKTRGGNATNTLCVLSQLDHQCHWAGVLIDETDTQAISQDLATHQIDTQACLHLPIGKMPTSYITRNQRTGSRTIIHYRDCPEYDLESFKNIDLTQFDWVHFEGRNVDQTRLMLAHLRQHHPELPCSLEIEKPRPDIANLFTYPDWLLFSKEYVLSQGFTDPETFLTTLTQAGELQANCTWGEQGAWAIDKTGRIIHQPVPQQQKIVDTLGAGDTFNAGFIHSRLKEDSLVETLAFAVSLANHKCTQIGLNNLINNFQYP